MNDYHTRDIDCVITQRISLFDVKYCEFDE